MAMPEEVTWLSLTSREALPYLRIDGESVLNNAILVIEIRERLNRALQILTNTEREVIIRRFGLYGTNPMTCEAIAWNSEEIGYRHPVTRERILQIQNKALSKLKHPSSAKYMKGVY